MQPASRNTSEKYRLFSSSNRAHSSITTVTSLPFSLAFLSASTIRERWSSLYMVILTAATRGSSAHSSNSLTNVSMLSNGYAKNISDRNAVSSTDAPCGTGGGSGRAGLYLSAGKTSGDINPPNAVMNPKSNPCLTVKQNCFLILSSFSANAFIPSAPASICKRTASCDPRSSTLRFKNLEKSKSRSISASSILASKSALRVTRSIAWLWILYPSNAVAPNVRISSSVVITFTFFPPSIRYTRGSLGLIAITPYMGLSAFVSSNSM